MTGSASRKVDARLPGKGNSNSHGARPVHLIITMIKWIRTSRLSISYRVLEVSGERKFVENDRERVGREFDGKLDPREEVWRAHESLLIQALGFRLRCH